MLNLVTGTPGSGKTLYVINELAKVTDRTIYYDGVPDLQLPWIPIPAKDWSSIPDGSILVVDEAQRIWGTRPPKDPVPDSIRAMETHRHRGIDIWVITQSPMMLDHHLRRLVGWHKHLRRNAGLPSSLSLEADEVIEDPQNPGAHVRRGQFVFPKDTYKLYKSAEVHTHKFKWTMRYTAMLVLVIAAISGIVWGFLSVADGIGGSPDPSRSGDGEGGGQSAQHAPPPSDYNTSLSDYIRDPYEQYIPRAKILPQSAPIYDGLNTAKQMPFVAGCIKSTDIVGDYTCKCYTQQGNDLHFSHADCEQHLAGLPFQYWREPDYTVPEKQSDERSSKDEKR